MGRNSLVVAVLAALPACFDPDPLPAAAGTSDVAATDTGPGTAPQPTEGPQPTGGSQTDPADPTAPSEPPPTEDPEGSSSSSDTTGPTSADESSSSSGEPEPCANGEMDGSETDVDCGGAACPPCAAGAECGAHDDCEDGYCLDMTTVMVCLPLCDPLLQDCGAGEGCFFTSVSSEFYCVESAADPAGGDQGDRCSFINDCNAGLMCSEAEVHPGCPKGEMCCTAFCDLNDPACPTGLECIPMFNAAMAPPGDEDVGFCGGPT